MRLIDKATAHFKSKAVRSQHFDQLEVTIYANPLNMETKSKWLIMADGNNADYLIYAIIFGALDKDGNHLFSLEDKTLLKKQVDAELISGIAGFVLNLDGIPEEEREKN